jgi:hypothetical protein
MNWNTYNVRGTREAAKAIISADSKLPIAAKTFILLELDSLPADCAHVSINGYAHLESHPRGHTRQIQITIAGS